ncbi:MAG: phage head morphogenesis protein, partial [Firmicutes bacterium]|nr:phage head morphogenesis protein [Bacillota bacterium]
VHPNCNCALIVLLCIKAGTATIDGLSGTDYYIKYYGLLPENYLSKREARAVGWKSYKGNLRDVTSDGTIGGDIYYNDDAKLPVASGRTWHEADINYTGGYRNTHRILYSNDGLIFVTYDHYETFYEIK